jgi:hypothetical protein
MDYSCTTRCFPMQPNVLNDAFCRIQPGAPARHASATLSQMRVRVGCGVCSLGSFLDFERFAFFFRFSQCYLIIAGRVDRMDRIERSDRSDRVDRVDRVEREPLPRERSRDMSSPIATADISAPARPETSPSTSVSISVVV